MSLAEPGTAVTSNCNLICHPSAIVPEVAANLPVAPSILAGRHPDNFVQFGRSKCTKARPLLSLSYEREDSPNGHQPFHREGSRGSAGCAKTRHPDEPPADR